MVCHALSGLKWGVDETQGVALGWNSNAPLGLNGRHAIGGGSDWVMTFGRDIIYPLITGVSRTPGAKNCRYTIAINNLDVITILSPTSEVFMAFSGAPFQGSNGGG
jgi:hypothetical protein